LTLDEIRQYCANRGLLFEESAYNFMPPTLVSPEVDKKTNHSQKVDSRSLAMQETKRTKALVLKTVTEKLASSPVVAVAKPKRQVASESSKNGISISRALKRR